MKTNHVLIDYENVQPAIGDLLASEVFVLWIFVGAHQTKISMELVASVQRKGPAGRFIQTRSSGRNALDFHMSFYVGEILAKDKDAYVHLISKDKGLDPLVAHLVERGFQIARRADVSDIPIIGRPASLSEEGKLTAIREFLIARGAQRPARMKTLLATIASRFHPHLAPEEAERLAQQLRQSGVIGLEGAKVAYNLP